MKAIDPVCGMNVDPAKPGATVEHEGRKYYFCCRHCAAKFEAEPAKYLQKAPAAAKDPVCGMTVDPTSAAGSAEHAGTKYFFCSKHCLAKFKAEPGRYAGGVPAAPAPARAGVEYTCPMHPEVVQVGPGSCPKCGMALVPMIPAALAAAEYTCPMHPEVRSATPGNCPKCGMALVPVAGAKEDDAELRDMTRRFWVGAVERPLVLLAMARCSA
jgi:Cu+-exporting ATPase